MSARTTFPSAAGASVLANPWWIAGIAVVGLFAVLFPTYRSMIEIWMRSDTFAHGFLIVPICIWLVWRQRDELADINPKVAPIGLLAAALLSFVWLLGNLADIIVVQQLAATVLVPAVVWAVLGTDVLRVLAFPLGYLIFAVPFGEVLIQPLMEFTASFTVKAVQLTGIPIY
ncbi:MAG: exosortase, partial [Gammaproteobacteria bacterium]